MFENKIRVIACSIWSILDLIPQDKFLGDILKTSHNSMAEKLGRSTRSPLTSPRDDKVNSLLVYGLLSGEELIAEFAKVVVSSP